MKDLGQIHRLFDLARQDPAPPTDVTEAVIARIARYQYMVAAWEQTWMWMAAISAAIAAIIAVVAVPYAQAAADPFAEVLEAVAWVGQ